jgi:hypothetical protein
MAVGYAARERSLANYVWGLPAPNPVLLRPIGKHQSIRRAKAAVRTGQGLHSRVP